MKSVWMSCPCLMTLGFRFVPRASCLERYHHVLKAEEDPFFCSTIKTTSPRHVLPAIDTKQKQLDQFPSYLSGSCLFDFCYFWPDFIINLELNNFVKTHTYITAISETESHVTRTPV